MARGLARSDRPIALRPATWPREDRGAQRLLSIDSARMKLTHRHLADLPRLLEPDDLLVVNDAATLPAALAARTETGEALELRLLGHYDQEFWAVVLGAGSWREPTEARGVPPPLLPGQRLTIVQPATPRAVPPEGAPDRVDRVDRVTTTLRATVRGFPLESHGAVGQRVVALEFERRGAQLWVRLYQLGRPIQYSYLRDSLELWHVQTVFAARPWAFELPSAAYGFTWQLLGQLRQRGVQVAYVTHAAGISSTGSEALDELLPLPERYEIPEATAHAVEQTLQRGQRVVAVGTTVVRALESWGQSGRPRPLGGEATLVLGPGYRPRIVDGVLSGIHQRGQSHYRLLQAFAPTPLLAAAEDSARVHGYQTHEFGDACLVLASRS